MAVSIDTVYQTVQALANKEQRGYITPQEFNLFANQAQNDIFEQYFYDINAFKRSAPAEHTLGNSVYMIKTKLFGFIGVSPVSFGTDLPGSKYHGDLFLGKGGTRRTLKQVDPDVVTDFNNSIFHKRGWTDAVWFDDGPGKIQVWDGNGQITSGISVEVISKVPGLCYWGYNVINEEPVYNPSATVDFELHKSEQPDLVIKILKLAGVSMEDQQLYSAASAEDGLNTQQENK